MSIVEDLLERTRYMGKFRALVTDNEDPDELRRIKVQCPAVAEEVDLPWALPCDNRRSDWIPDKGDIVWIEFEQGYHLEHPIYVGLAMAKDDMSEDFKDNYGPKYRKDWDVNGNSIEWKEDGMVIKDKNNNNAIFNEDGIEIKDKHSNKTISDSSGYKIEDKNGNKIKMDVAGTKLVTGDASPWQPNILSLDPMTGIPHGGAAAGILKLTGG